jgi:uncharacterized protein (TIGR04255 family)
MIEKEHHPTYPNPVIEEALCEIHFRMPEAHPWQTTFGSDFFHVVQEAFPQFETLIEQGVTFKSEASGSLQQQYLPPRHILRLKHKEEPYVLHLGEELFALNRLKVYPGWQPVRNMILTYWQKMVSVIKPEVITRVGLRYINLIPLEENETASCWLKATPYFAEHVLNSSNGFSSRVETYFAPNKKAAISLGEAYKEKSRHLLFDIDCILEKDCAVDVEALTTVLDGLHEQEWSVFSSAVTPALEQVMKGE